MFWFRLPLTTWDQDSGLEHLRAEGKASITWHPQCRGLFQLSQIGFRGSQLYCWETQTYLKRDAVGSVQDNQLSLSTLWLGRPGPGTERCPAAAVGASVSPSGSLHRVATFDTETATSKSWAEMRGRRLGKHLRFGQWTRQRCLCRMNVGSSCHC